MNELQTALDFLAHYAPWLPAALKWYATLSTVSRILLKPFSARIQARLTNKIVAAHKLSPGLWDPLLNSRRYRWTAFWLDLIFSFKLPTAETVNVIQTLDA